MKIVKLLNNNIVANQVKAFPKISKETSYRTVTDIYLTQPEFCGKSTSFKFTKHQSRMNFSLVGTSVIWRKPDSLFLNTILLQSSTRGVGWGVKITGNHNKSFWMFTKICVNIRLNMFIQIIILGGTCKGGGGYGN
jgi:hypothetical protein